MDLNCEYLKEVSFSVVPSMLLKESDKLKNLVLPLTLDCIPAIQFDLHDAEGLGFDLGVDFGAMVMRTKESFDLLPNERSFEGFCRGSSKRMTEKNERE